MVCIVFIHDSFGVAAGFIWKLLNADGTIQEKQLRKKTRLKTGEFNAAIGWLARENKIVVGDGWYQLGPTNIHDHIGTQAGMVWQLLDMWGELESSLLAVLTDVSDDDIFFPLGWLACENKIVVEKTSSQQSSVLVRLLS